MKERKRQISGVGGGALNDDLCARLPYEIKEILTSRSNKLKDHGPLLLLSRADLIPLSSSSLNGHIVLNDGQPSLSAARRTECASLQNS